MPDGVPLVEKWRPESLTDVQGNNKDIAELKAWLRDFEEGDPAHLLYGPPGVGKSSTAEALANEFDMPLSEINASDSRKTDDVADFVEEAETQPFTGGYRLILLDEVDSMSGQANLSPLYDMLDSPSNPVLLVCNEKYDVPDGIVDRVEEHNFSLGTRSIKAKLKEIVKEEGFDVGASTLSMLSKRESLRGAIQDLQVFVQNSDGVTSDSGRHQESSVFEEMDRVIKGQETSLSETPDRSTLWIDRNIRDRYRLVEAAAAWDALSRADMLNGRVWNGQADPDYRWWRYSGTILEMIPNLRLSDPYTGYLKKSSPDYYGYDDVPSEVQSVFRKLSTGPEDALDYGGSLHFFRHKTLPLLMSLDVDARCEIANLYDLDEGEFDVLEISESEYESWKDRQLSGTEEVDMESSQSSFMDW